MGDILLMLISCKLQLFVEQKTNVLDVTVDSAVFSFTLLWICLVDTWNVIKSVCEDSQQAQFKQLNVRMDVLESLHPCTCSFSHSRWILKNCWVGMWGSVWVWPLCYPQDTVLWDECSDRSRGGQGGDNAARPGHEADGTVRRQTTRRAGQRQWGDKTFRGAAHWEEMCMLDEEAIQHHVVCPFYSPHSFYVLWLHVCSCAAHSLVSKTTFNICTRFFSFLNSLPTILFPSSCF